MAQQSNLTINVSAIDDEKKGNDEKKGSERPRPTFNPKKSLAMLGVNDGSNFVPENDSVLVKAINQGLIIPKELKETSPTKFSVLELYNLHVPELGYDEAKNIDRSNDATSLYQLVFDVKHCIFKAGNDTILLFSIFNETTKMFISEEYCLNLSVHNFPKIGSPEDCKILFRDLTYEQLQNDLYVVCRIYRIGGMDPPKVAQGQGSSQANQANEEKSGDLIRPYGVTVFALKTAIPSLLKKINKEIDVEAGEAEINCPKDDTGFIELPFDLISNKKQGQWSKAPLSIGIAHAYTLFRGPVDVVKSYSGWKSLTHIHMLNINPQTHQQRHVLYITIREAHVNQRNKRSQCNVMLKLQLRRNDTYKPIKNAISFGQGPMAQIGDEAVSPVYYHLNDPNFHQTYAVLIPANIKDLEECHLFFSLWHTPGSAKKPDERGFAFLPLYQSNLKQLTVNNEYELPIYKSDKKGEAANYLNSDNLKPENKTIRIYFQLSSTKIISDIDIHQFLTWKDQNPQITIQVVKRLAKKNFENEILVVLDELMKTIFEILRDSDDKTLKELTFGALVTILGEVTKTSHAKYHDRIDEWINQHFAYPLIWRTLISEQLRLLTWISSNEAVQAERGDASVQLKQLSADLTRQLQNCMKAIEYVFKLMKRSCKIEVEQNPQNKANITKEYNSQVSQLFDSLNKCMGLSEPRSVAGVQSFSLRNFLSLMDSVPTQTSEELTKVAVRFINSVQNTGVHNNVEKLLLLRRVLQHPRLKRIDVLKILLPCVIDQLEKHINSPSIDERVSCATILKFCIPLLDPKRPRLFEELSYFDLTGLDEKEQNEVMNEVGGQPSEEILDAFTGLMLQFFGVLNTIRKTDLSEVINVQRIFGKSLNKNPNNEKERSFSVVEINVIDIEQLRIQREFFISLTDLARIVTGCSGNPSTYGQKSDRVDAILAKIRKTNEDQAQIIIESVLNCCNSFLRVSMFEKPFLFLRMIEAELAMRGLSWFGSTLKGNYLNKHFKKGLWNQWLGLGMAFLSIEDFAIEDLTKDRANLLNKNYGDLRNIAIKKLNAAWDVLTPHRSDLAETMISAAVEASASEVKEIQDFAVDVYFQMMKSEFEQTNAMKTVETFTIDQVDQLAGKYSHQDNIIERYLDFFRKRIYNKLNTSDNKLKKMGEQFISEIEKLYSYLVKLKKLPSDAEHEDERTNATLLLLNYLETSNKTELWNRYMHHLAIVHQTLGNSVEAAICYQAHAAHLGWSSTLLRAEPQVGLEACEEYKRHIQLLENAQKLFLIGEAWEMGIRICQELALNYEKTLYNLESLSAILEKQSQLWKFISRHDRVFNACYLVTFKGKFDNDNLKNKSFVYKSGKGKNPEPVRDFTERIKKKWPNAKIVNSGDPFPDEVLDNKYDGQYIRITTLIPSSKDELNGNEFKWDNTEAPLRMKKYYREMETNVFYYTYQQKIKKTNNNNNKNDKNDNEFRNLWITKVFIVAENEIPCMRRRVPVIEEKNITYTPLQTAINNLIEKNKLVLKVIATCEQDVKHNTNDLSMQLNGVLDAAVMGGITKYREAFFDGTYFTQYPQEQKLTSAFKEALRKQLDVARDGLDVYEKYCTEALAPHVEHLKGCYIKMQRDLQLFLNS